MSKPSTFVNRYIPGFTIIPNSCLQDYDLSLAARGLLTTVLSLPSGWHFNRLWAQQRFGVGREKLENLISELVKSGYCRIDRERLPGGTFGRSTVTSFTAIPGEFGPPSDQTTGKPYLGSETALTNGSHQNTGKPGLGESAPYKETTFLEKKYIKEGEAVSSTPSPAAVDKSHNSALLKPSDPRQDVSRRLRPKVAPVRPGDRLPVSATAHEAVDFAAARCARTLDLPLPSPLVLETTVAVGLALEKLARDLRASPPVDPIRRGR